MRYHHPVPTRASIAAWFVIATTACRPAPLPPFGGPIGPAPGPGPGSGPGPAAPPSSAVQIALGQYHACAVDTTGRIACWGGNHVGQLGNGGLAHDPQPRYVDGPSGVTSLAAGSGQTCAVAASGAVWCWGGNFVGEAGQPIGELVLTPRPVEGVPPMRRVIAGMERTCAVSTADELWCWGASVRMTGSPIVAPARIATGIAGAVAVDEDAVCATIADEIRCWRRPEDPTVAVVAIAAPDTRELVVLQGRVAARDGAGRVRIFDWNQGTDVTGEAPWHRELSLDRPAAAIAGGGPRLCVLTDGVVRCRGNRNRVELGADGATELAASSSTVCAAIDGALRCSGDGDRGQLGAGDLGAGRSDGWTQVRPPDAARDQGQPPPALTSAAAISCRPPAAPALAPPALTRTPAQARLCGNGAVDGGPDESQPPLCAPCMEGNSCPCSQPMWREQCDGRPAATQTCAALGYFGGTLTCSRTCTLDRSGCRACSDAPGVTCATTTIAAAPSTRLLATGTADAIAVAWGDPTACGQHLAIFDDRLAARGHVGFGAAGETAIGLVATPTGFVAATTSGAGGHVEFFDRQGQTQRRWALTGVAPAFVVATASGAVWLGQWQAVSSPEPGFGAHALWVTPIDPTGAIGAPAQVTTMRSPIAVQAAVRGERLGLFMNRALVELTLGARAVLTRTTALGTDGNTLATLDGNGQLLRLTLDGGTATLARSGAAPAAIDLLAPLGGAAAAIDLSPTAALFRSDHRLGVLEFATGRLRAVRATDAPGDARLVERPGDAAVVVWIESGVLGLARVAAR